MKTLACGANRNPRHFSLPFILLACRAVGLGASLTTAHRAHSEEIDRLIGLHPEKTPSIAMLPIGWPKGKFGRPTRRSIDEYFYVDRYSGEPLHKLQETI